MNIRSVYDFRAVCIGRTLPVIRTQCGLTLCGTVLALLAGTPSVRAISPLTLTLNQAAQTVQPGSTLLFTGTLSNTTFSAERLYFGGDDLNFIGSQPDGLNLDDSPFLANAPATLDTSFPYSGSLFTMTVAPGTPQGIYSGTFEVEYDDAAGNPFLASQGFQVNVSSASTPVPEASTTASLGLLLALGGVAFAVKRRKAPVA